MIQRYFAYRTERSVQTIPGKTERVQEAASLSPEEIEQAIIREWNSLQQVPSYVEGLLKVNRGLIESIAAQH